MHFLHPSQEQSGRSRHHQQSMPKYSIPSVNRNSIVVLNSEIRHPFEQTGRSLGKVMIDYTNPGTERRFVSTQQVSSFMESPMIQEGNPVITQIRQPNHMISQPRSVNTHFTYFSPSHNNAFEQKNLMKE